MDLKMWQAVAAVVVVSLIASTGAVAEPTLSGFSGLLTIPTADVVAPRTFNLGVNSGELEDWDNFSYYTNFGLDEGTEVGALMFRSDAGSSSSVDSATASISSYNQDETFLSLKRVLSDADRGPSIAAGIFDVTDEVDTTVYMVATWAQGRDVGQVDGRTVQFLNLHAGFGAGMIDHFFAGVDLRFGPDMTIMGEWVDDDINVGARFSPAKNFTVDAGLLNVEDLAVNVSYSSSL